jgi:lipopolysaccharide/colanic/teichoic acid biosynthesis glycosyltransferase
MISKESMALFDTSLHDFAPVAPPVFPIRRTAAIRPTDRANAAPSPARRRSESHVSTPRFESLTLPPVSREPSELPEQLVQPAGNLALGYRIAKRSLDIVGALALLVFLGPIMLGAFLILCITTRGRPLFRQERVGHCGRRFRMLKFRTMQLDAVARQAEVRNEQEGPVFKNRRDPRITRFGRLLRSLSIDETPQLFNVLAGQMSLVGPRPPMPAEVAQYQPWQRQRLAVKPGLTCLWQVSGRCEIGFEQWVRMDLWYIQNQSLKTDVKLLLATPLSVLSRRGAY